MTDAGTAPPVADASPSRRSVVEVCGRVIRSFLAHRGLDLAAALTYFSVLSLVPALIALVALLGLVGEAEESVAVALQILDPLLTDDMLDSFAVVLESLANAAGAGSAFVISVIVGLWSASAYVGAFSRAMNQVYDVEEGRPYWRLRPSMVLLTLVQVTLVASLLVMLVVTGPIAEGVGEVFGLGDQVLRLWDLAKWPLVAVVSVVVVALLYQATPNVRLPRFRLLSIGAGFAIGTFVVVAVGFGYYVSNLANYDAIYGSLAGAVVSLLFLWIANIALLFGAELDLEAERIRQLRAGIAAEDRLQLEPRATSGSEAAARRHQADVEAARRVRVRVAASKDAAAGSTAERAAE